MQSIIQTRKSKVSQLTFTNDFTTIIITKGNITDIIYLQIDKKSLYFSSMKELFSLTMKGESRSMKISPIKFIAKKTEYMTTTSTIMTYTTRYVDETPHWSSNRLILKFAWMLNSARCLRHHVRLLSILLLNRRDKSGLETRTIIFISQPFMFFVGLPAIRILSRLSVPELSMSTNFFISSMHLQQITWFSRSLYFPSSS